MGYGNVNDRNQPEVPCCPVRCRACTPLSWCSERSLRSPPRSAPRGRPCGQSMLSQLTPVGEASRGYSLRHHRGVVRRRRRGGWRDARRCDGAARRRRGRVRRHHRHRARPSSPGSRSSARPSTPACSASRRRSSCARSTKTGSAATASWVYGSGFGWQVGAGVTTYIMTTAVFLTIAMGALTAGPIAALSLGILFGLVRGLAVLLTARLRTHRRAVRVPPPVRRARRTGSARRDRRAARSGDRRDRCRVRRGGRAGRDRGRAGARGRVGHRARRTTSAA